jgi:hypothetical protein
LVFHNNVWKSARVHFANMYRFVFVIADFFQNGLYFEFILGILISFVVK